MEQNITWELNRGSISFIWDNWLGSGFLGETVNMRENLKVIDFLTGENWNLNKLSYNLPNHIIEKICSHQVCLEPHKNDNMIWMLSQSGEFSVKSAYELIRSSRPKSYVDSMVWQKGIPKKMSFCVSNI